MAGNLLIVTPVYAPAPGGGAQYTKILANCLLDLRIFESVTVVTERYPGEPHSEDFADGRSRVRRIYPFRAGRDDRGLGSYLSYAWQNIQFLNLPRWVKQFHSDVVMIHGSFHLNPGTMGAVVRILSRMGTSRPKLVADIRDPRLPRRHFHRLLPYDAIFCCSRRIVEMLSADDRLRNRLHLLPIPLDAVDLPAHEVDAIIERYGQQGRPYIFTANGISDDKGFGVVFDTWCELLRRDHRLDLLVAGRKRSWHGRYSERKSGGKLQYLGSIANRDVHALYLGSNLVMNPCTIDGLPRMTLEAMHAGAPVMVPPHIPEFAGFDRDLIAATNCPMSLADQIERIWLQNLRPLDYDFHQHNPRELAAKAGRIIDSIWSPSAFSPRRKPAQ